MAERPPHLLIVGCGLVGRQVGRQGIVRGQSVYGLARTDESCQAIAATGLQPIKASLDDAPTLEALPINGAHVYYFAPPPREGQTDPRIEAFCRTLSAKKRPAKLVLISTSGVYGDCKGALVDETHPIAPSTDRAKRRAHAEGVARRCGRVNGFPVVVLRVAGIYSAEKLPLERIRQRQPVVRTAEASFTNRIHLDDLTAVCIAAMERGRSDQIYNVCDGEASTMTDYFNAIADAHGLPRPPQVSLHEAHRVMTPRMLTYMKESRRLDNRKMIEQLGVQLRYPTLADALHKI